MTNSNTQFSVKLLSDVDSIGYRPTTVCSHCGCEDQRAAGLFFGDDEPRTVLCESCLSKLQTVMRHGRREDFSRWEFTLKKFNGPRQCTYFHEEPHPVAYQISGSGFNVKLCDDCVNTVYQQLRYYNEHFNEKYIAYVNEKREVNRLKATLEEEDNFKKVLQKVIAESQDISLVDNLLSIGAMNVEQFFEQYGLYKKYSVPYHFVREKKNKLPRGSRSIFIDDAFARVLCDVHPFGRDIEEAQLFIHNNDSNLSDFKFCTCINCAKDFAEAVQEIISNPDKKKVKRNTVIIKRETEYNDCYHCGSDSHYYVQWKNLFFHTCEICLGRLHRKIEKYLMMNLPDYEEHKIYMNPNNQFIVRTMSLCDDGKYHRLNSKVKDITGDFNFIVRSVKAPVKCDCIGHDKADEARYIITTDNKKINFSFVLCRKCRNKLIQALAKKEGEFIDQGNAIKVSPVELSKGEHCLFCPKCEGAGKHIRIGNLDFFVDKHHANQLLARLQSLKF